MASIYDWSATAASNTSIGSINWAEGMAPSAVNDSARYEMADVAKWRDFLGGAKISSGTNTITLTSGLSLSAYAQGQMFAFEAGAANTGAATLNVDSVGAKDIKKFHDVALASGDIEAAGIYLVAYEATADNFQLISPVSNAPGDAFLSVAQLWTAQQRPLTAALTYNATQTWDCSAAQDATLTLTGNVTTFSAPTNQVAGSYYTLRLNLGSTPYTVSAWNAVFKWPAATAPTLSTGANAIDVFVFRSDGTNMENIGQSQAVA